MQTWEVRITAASTPVGSLTAVRGLYWKSDNLRERMVDEQSFPALVAAQLLDEASRFTYEFEEFIESASSVLVVDRLQVEEAFADRPDTRRQPLPPRTRFRPHRPRPPGVAGPRHRGCGTARQTCPAPSPALCRHSTGGSSEPVPCAAAYPDIRSAHSRL
ncbi:hypothetical protein [Streptomyces lydicus]|uniref:hypothetical protein n=1 Tax=Streptomyces lydicus TaxID=47763 RepID=UPI001012974C|nr:hypothetical protein [Streptomyces lydicus]